MLSSNNHSQIQTVISPESVYRRNPQSPTSTLHNTFSEEPSKKENCSFQEANVDHDDMPHIEILYCDSKHQVFKSMGDAFEIEYTTNIESSRTYTSSRPVSVDEFFENGPNNNEVSNVIVTSKDVENASVTNYRDHAINVDIQEDLFHRKQRRGEKRKRFKLSRKRILPDQDNIGVFGDSHLMKSSSKDSIITQLIKHHDHRQVRQSYNQDSRQSNMDCPDSISAQPQINDIDDIIIHALEYEKAGSYKKALKFYDIFLSLKLRQHQESSSEYKCPRATIDLFYLIHNYSMLQWKVGSYKKAIRYCYQVLKLDNKLCDVFRSQDLDLARAETYLCLGNSYLSMGDHKEALKYFRQSLRLRKQIHGCHDHPDVASSIICMGKAFEENGRLNRAMRCYREGLRIQQSFFEHDFAGVAMTFNCVGVIYEKWREYTSAIECYQLALTLFQTAFGNDNVDVALTLSNIGQIYRHLRQYDEAMLSSKEALRIFNGLLGDQHRNVASTIHNIALIHVARDENTVAMKTLKKVLSLQTEALGKIHADVAVTLDSLAGVYQKIGKTQKAVEVYKKAIQVRCKVFGEKHLFVGISYHKLSLVQKENSSSLKHALQNLKRGLDIYRENSLTDENIRVRTILRNIEEINKCC